MAVYHLSTRINSNVPADTLLYDLCIYRMDANRNKYPWWMSNNSRSWTIMQRKVT